MNQRSIIKIGKNYIFTKSGNEVKVLEKTSMSYNGKKVYGHTVERTDSKKRLFCISGTLKTKKELNLD